MHQICAGNDEKASDTEEMPFEGICKFTRDLTLQENMHSIDVRILHRILDIEKHLSPVGVDLMQRLVNR